jgi:hypothetical protein
MQLENGEHHCGAMTLLEFAGVAPRYGSREAECHSPELTNIEIGESTPISA